MGYSEEIDKARSNSIAFFYKDVCIQKALEKVSFCLGNLKKIDIEISYYRNSSPENFDISWPTAGLIEEEKLDHILTLVIDDGDLEDQLFFICNLLMIGELRSTAFSRVGVVEPFHLRLEKQIPGWLRKKIILLPLEISKILDFLSEKPLQNRFFSQNIEKIQALYMACICKIVHSLKNGDYFGGYYSDLDFPFFKRALSYMKGDVEKLKIFSLFKLIEETQNLMRETDLDEIKEKLEDINQSWNKVYVKCTRIRGKIFKEESWADIVVDLNGLEKI